MALIEQHVKLYLVETLTAAFEPLIRKLDAVTQVFAETFNPLLRIANANPPVRTRSGRWRVRLYKTGGERRSAVYRTRDLAIDALLRSFVQDTSASRIRRAIKERNP
jgi:hypothetical protein